MEYQIVVGISRNPAFGGVIKWDSSLTGRRNLPIILLNSSATKTLRRKMESEPLSKRESTGFQIMFLARPEGASLSKA
jgi:hypothetical protein